MQKFFRVRRIEEICEKLNSLGLHLNLVTNVGVNYDVVCGLGLEKGDEYQIISEAKPEQAMEFIASIGGQVHYVFSLGNGRVKFLTLVNDKKMKQALKKKKEQEAETQRLKEEAEKQKQIEELNAQKEAIAMKEKELGIEVTTPNASETNDGGEQSSENGEGQQSENTDNQGTVTSPEENQ